VALEQCCEAARLLPPQLRETRLQHFSLEQRFAVEAYLAEIPAKVGKRVLPFIYWAVRIERAKRTGSPEFNPKRPLVVEGWRSSGRRCRADLPPALTPELQYLAGGTFGAVARPAGRMPSLAEPCRLHRPFLHFGDDAQLPRRRTPLWSPPVAT